MKKILVAALVAILASSFVFAGFNGSASVGLGFNTVTGKYGFSNNTGVKVNVDLVSAKGEAVAEGDVYAGIKASLALNLVNQDSDADNQTNLTNGLALATSVAIDEAFVAGENWKVSILGTLKAPNYATTGLEEAKYNFKVASKAVPGVTVSFADWKASVGFVGDTGKGSSDKASDKFYEFNAFVETPEFAFEGLTVKAAAIASRDVTNVELDQRYSAAAGLSTKVGFDFDTVSGSVAADYGIKKVADKYTNGFDVDAKLAIDPVSVEVYYKNNDFTKKDNNWLHAVVATDLNSFDVPVALSVKGTNLLSANSDKNAQSIFFNAETKFDAFTVGANVGYKLKDKKLSTGVEVAYEHDMFTAEASLNFANKFGVDNAKELWATASIESDSIVPGATLALTYGKSSKKSYINFLKNQQVAQNFGKVEATCTIEF